MMRLPFCAFLLAISPFSTALAAEPVINPYPRAVIRTAAGDEWDLEKGPSGWRAERDATTVDSSGTWKLAVRAPDPILVSPRLQLDGQLTVHLRMRTTAAGPAQIFWIAADQPGAAEARSTRFDTEADGQWRDYHVTLPFEGLCRELRFDPAMTSGEVEIDSLQIEVRTLHPLEIESLASEADAADLTLRNHGAAALTAAIEGQTVTVPARAREVVRVSLPTARRPYERLTFAVTAGELPAVSRSAWRISSSVAAEWLTLESEQVRLEVAPDGQGARVLRKGNLVAHIAPLAAPLNGVADWQLQRTAKGIRASTKGGDTLELTLQGDQLDYRLVAKDGVWTGPVVRAMGVLEQGLLPGVEHLGRGEASSSTLDVRGPEHIRFRPDRRHVTQPLLAVITEVGSVALSWRELTLQPVLATPNFFDGTDDHRLALEGREIQATLRLGDSFATGTRLETLVLWGLQQQGGLPTLPTAPRSPADQAALSLAGLQQSALKAPNGQWYHAILTGQKSLPEHPQPFADMASTIYRLTGQSPQRPLSAGGAHIANDTALFLTGQAQAWLDRVTGVAAQARSTQQPDGSWRYDGRFREGHFENTASGYCGQFAMQLMDHARWTGNAESLAAGLKGLEFCKRFRTPRGASVWECPLHAPDLLASAHLTRAYLIAFQLTGREEYRELAVRWAVSGLPYVYLWGDKPVMLYATTGTLCATHFEAPVWIGRPVQWMGLVYADALLDLAPHDQTVPWKQLAEGIVLSAEQQQYTDGPSKGLLPDSWLITPQQPQPYDINPCAMVSLRQRLSEQPAGLEFVTDGLHRVISPFAVRIDGAEAEITAPVGVKYQVLVDGRVVEVTSNGMDRIALTGE